MSIPNLSFRLTFIKLLTLVTLSGFVCPTLAADEGITLLDGHSSRDARKASFRIVFDPITGQLRYQTMETTESTSPPDPDNCDNEPPPPSTYRAFPIYFEVDKDVLKSDADTQTTLEGIRDFLVEHPETEVRIEGHTDSQASASYNLNLSQRRAATVKAWLASNGVDDSRMAAVGKGEDSPNFRADESDKSGVDKEEFETCAVDKPPSPSQCETNVWSRTRRVEVWVTSGVDQLQKPCEGAKRSTTTTTTRVIPLVDAECPWAVGPRFGVLGPQSWVNLGVALQPIRHCELEFGLTLGLKRDRLADTNGRERTFLQVPLILRGALWLGRNHAFVPEAGVGVAPANTEFEGVSLELLAHLGIGYGYRQTRSGGWRFGASAGLIAQTGDGFLGGPTVLFDPPGELGLYGELRVGYMIELDGGR